MLRNFTFDQAVERLNVDPVELRFLVHHFSEFLTSTTPEQAERTFDSNDVQILSRIYRLINDDKHDPGTVRILLRNEMGSETDRANSSTTLAFCSGRPGTGKSSLIFNLATALCARGKRCTIFDGSLGNSGILALLPGSGVNTPWLQGLPSGAQLISGEKYIEVLEHALEADAVALESQLAELNANSDYILVDTGSGKSDNALRYAMAVDEIVIVTMADVGANADCFAVIRMLKDVDPDLSISLVVDRAVNHGIAREVLSRMNGAARTRGMDEIPGLGWISEDDGMHKCMNEGEAVVNVLPTAMASRCITRLADHIVSRMNFNKNISGSGLPALVQSLHNVMQRSAPPGV